MAVLEIAIDIGTSNTSIYLSGHGIVLREPTAIAYFGEPSAKKIRAVGKEAYAMRGRSPDRTTVVTPVQDGYIVDPQSMILLLREFIKRLLPQNYILFPKIKAIVAVPMGLTLEERRIYEDVCFDSFVREVTIVDNIMLSAIGIDLPISTPSGGIICNVGGGVTEVAAFSLSGVLSGCAVSIGGNMMDRAIMDTIAGKHDLKLGINSVTKIKEEIASLYDNDVAQINVNGIDLLSKGVGNSKIYAYELCEVLKPYYLRVGDAIQSIINVCPAEIVAEIIRTGIYVVGGASSIMGLDKLLSNHLNINVYTPIDPQISCIVGAGKLQNNYELMNDILRQR